MNKGILGVSGLVVLLGCVERGVGVGGSTSGAETGGGTASASTSQGPQPTGGGSTSGVMSGGSSGGGGSGGTSGGGVVDAGDGCMFVVSHPDVGGQGLQCDTYKQDCGACEKCSPWAEGGGSAWNATKCVPVTGSKKPGEPCTVAGRGVSGEDDCERGAMCWDVDSMGMGTCIAQCAGTLDEPVCPMGTFCLYSSGPLNLCFRFCDPLVQDCPEEEVCLPEADGFSCVLDASGDMGAVNDPCEFANACDKGLVCLNTASASSACMQASQGCCQPFCEFMEGQDGDCPNPDQKCLQWYDPMMEIPAGYEDVGVCAIPG